MKVSELIGSWGLPDRSAERVQITLRLPYSEYARLHALKEVYSSRSVNDLISDLIRVGLDEVVESLPFEYVPDEEVRDMVDSDAEFHRASGKVIRGVKVEFQSALHKILEQKSSSDDVKVVQLSPEVVA